MNRTATTNTNTPTILMKVNGREEATSLERLTGGLCFGIFVGIWLASAAFSFVFLVSLWYSWHRVTVSMVIATIIAYIPWKTASQYQSILPAVQRLYARYPPKYLDRCTISLPGSKKNKNEPPSPNGPQTFYAIHPHGAFCIGWAILYCSDMMQHVRFCFAPMLYAMPLFRFFSRCAGRPGSAAKADMKAYLQKGDHVALPPGGFEEATLTCSTKDRVFLKKRYGFIRLCLEQGVQVRPVYVFGENAIFWNVQGLFLLRLAMNRYGIPTIFPWGRWALPLLPKRNVPIDIVIGEPLILPTLPNPTKEDVTLWHTKYMVALTGLFEENKERVYGSTVGKTKKLEVW